MATEKDFKGFHINVKKVPYIDDTDASSMDEQEVYRFKQDTAHRKTLVKWMMWVVSLWLGIVLGIVIANRWLLIEKEIIITLLATTTINVLGLANIILRGMFPKRSRLKTKKKNQPNNPLPW